MWSQKMKTIQKSESKINTTTKIQCFFYERLFCCHINFVKTLLLIVTHFKAGIANRGVGGGYYPLPP